MSQEQKTLGVVQQALISTGLASRSEWSSSRLGARAVITPVRWRVNRRNGSLPDSWPTACPSGGRTTWRGWPFDDYMASELQHRIRQLEELSRLQQRFVADVSMSCGRR